MKRLGLVFAVALVAALTWAQGRESNNPATGPHLGSQAAADLIRDAAGADGAFLAAGSLNSTFDQKNLASLMQFPNEEIVIMKLKGSDIRQAFERAVSVYPQPHHSFLQISGFTVEFNPAAVSNKRIKSVSTDSGSLDDNKTYRVAMPSQLGKGGMGFFKVWDKDKIEKTVAGKTLESVLKGKAYAATSPRWVARS